MKAKELRGLADEALQEELAKNRRELLELRCQVAMGEGIRPHRIKETRRDIARILTVMTERAKARSANSEGKV